MAPCADAEAASYAPPLAPVDALSLQRQVRACAEEPGLAAVVVAHPVPTLVLNRSRQIVAANAAATALAWEPGVPVVGLRLGEALGCRRSASRPGTCGTLPGCEVCGAAQTLACLERTGRASQGECRITTDRASLDLRVSARPLTAAGEALYLCVVEDTGDARRRQALERIFFHDALNVAGALQGYLMLFGALGPEEVLELGRRLAPLADQLVEEIQAQRDLVDAERGELVARSAEVSVLELLERVEAVCGQRAREAGVRLLFAPPALGATVVSDPVLLRRVLGNLVKNAVEASQSEDVVRVGFAADSISFEVSNPAVMSEPVARQVFQRSFTTKADHGRGLGTYSVRLLTERYLGGRVTFQSAVGLGTRFAVLLPPDAAGSARGTVARPGAQASTRGANVAPEGEAGH